MPMAVTGALVASGAALVSTSVYQRRSKKKLVERLYQPGRFGGESLESGNSLTETGTSLAEETSALAQEAMSEAYRNIGLAGAGMGFVLLGFTVATPLMFLSLPIYLYLSAPFILDGIRQIFQERRVGVAVMDSIVAISVLAFGFFWAAGIFFILYTISVMLITKTRNQSADGLVDLIGVAPRVAWIEVDGLEIERPVAELEVGDIIIVHSSEAIPVDGIVVDGMASVDQHMLTGESQPAEMAPGDKVFAATTVLSNELRIRVERKGEETVAAQIEHVLNSTASFQSSIESRGEIMADQGARPMLLLSALTLPFMGASSAIAVLFASFGYNMRIVAPLSVLNFLRKAMERSILVKDGRALESLSEVDTFVFDKTGTLTLEQPNVAAIHSTAGYSEEEILRYAAAAEHRQTHPVAHAIRDAAKERGLNVPTISDAHYEMGYGIRVQVEEKQILVGSERFMQMEDIAIPEAVAALQETSHVQGHSLIFIAIGNEVAGLLEMAPTIRSETQEMIHGLHERGMSMYIISGDAEAPTRHLANQLGIENYFAQVLPEDKADLIDKLQKEGRKVCFIGDGINDSIALKKANVSVSLRGASTIATDTAQVLLMDQSLKGVVPLVDLSRDMDRNMNNSMRISIVPSVLTLAGVYFFHFGILAANFIYCAGLLTAVGNSMLPALDKDKQITDKSPTDSAKGLLVHEA